MNVINLLKRERDSQNVVCKYNTLNGRWFEKTGLSVPKEDSSEIVKKKVIESDSVVSIEGGVGVFLVFVVWRKDLPGNSKSGEQFPSINGDNPYYPVLLNQLKSYKIDVREIGFGQDDKVMYKEYDPANNNAVEDGENVHQSYRFGKLGEIRGLRFKVGI